MSKPMQPSHTIQNTFIQLFTICLLCFSQQLSAEVKLPSVDDRYVELKIEDPVRDAGYVVGDILNRKITITIKKPYQLIEESLPIVGYEHRYKGQVSGIELSAINKKTTESADSETHILNLSYQVFKTDRVAKPAALRAEILRLRNTDNIKETVEYRIPSFNFRVSPLSVIGQIKLDQEMYPLIPPLTIDSSQVVLRLKILAGLLALALIGLLYMFGTYAWLPRMGAPFARAYRDIKKMDNTPEGIKQAVSRVHESLNKTAGASLFSNNLNAFITKKPAFAPAKQQIEQFFGFSHQVFFEDRSQALDHNNPKAWLLNLCLNLRHCERGLVPDMSKGDHS
jgi:mxaA protein